MTAKKRPAEWQIKKSKQKRELMIEKCKQSWEKARVGHLSEEERTPLIELLMSQISGHIEEVVFKHDASRIVQCCIKYGNKEDILKIYTELKPRMLDLIKSTYGKYIVLALLNHSKEIRIEIIELFKGRVDEFLKKKDSAYITEVIYHTYSSPKQKKIMINELFCNQVKKSPQYSGMTLTQVLETNASLKDVIYSSMKKTLFTLIQKGGLGDMTIILRALWEFLSYFPEEDFIEPLQEQIVEFLHHKDGMKIANFVLRRSGAKSRKTVLKSFKPHLSKIWQDEYGHMVLITAFDCVDDTKMVQKALISDILLKLDVLDILNNQYVRRVILYLLTQSLGMTPNNYRQDFLLERDWSKETSKKDNMVRFEELKEMCSNDFMAFIKSNLGKMLQENSCDLILNLCLESEEILTELINDIVDLVSNDIKLLENQTISKYFCKLLRSKYNLLIVKKLEPVLASNLKNIIDTEAKFVIGNVMKDSSLLKASFENINCTNDFYLKFLK
eukprot:NODE_124_length_17341_cov_0.560028.p5 type:complete len:501 gc:universal NODE_124_length_17341_cov_0.560028:4722-6224(+)